MKENQRQRENIKRAQTYTTRRSSSSPRPLSTATATLCRRPSGCARSCPRCRRPAGGCGADAPSVDLYQQQWQPARTTEQERGAVIWKIITTLHCVLVLDTCMSYVDNQYYTAREQCR